MNSYVLRATVLRRTALLLGASSQADLIIQVAICGRLINNKVFNNTVCAACSRFDNFRVPEYFDELARNIRHHVVDKFFFRFEPATRKMCRDTKTKSDNARVVWHCRYD